jgi:hypothetical protein
MNDQSNLPAPISNGLDGCDDDGGTASIIKGVKIKFTNEGEWETADGTAIAPNREFVVVQIDKAVQKWQDQTPVKTIPVAPDEKFPNVDELNAAEPREFWSAPFGVERGPWQRCYVVYLLDLQSMQVFTYPTSTNGGSRAVQDLRNATRLARRLRGPGIYPRVRLIDVHMNTRYGGRQRPAFEIVGYEKLGEPEKATIAAAESKQIESAKPKTEDAKAPDKRSAPKLQKVD